MEQIASLAEKVGAIGVLLVFIWLVFEDAQQDAEANRATVDRLLGIVEQCKSTLPTTKPTRPN